MLKPNNHSFAKKTRIQIQHFHTKMQKLTPCIKHMKFAYNNSVEISSHQK